MTQRELKYSIFAIPGKFVYLGKCVALRMCYAKNSVKDFDLFWQVYLLWWDDISLLKFNHEKGTKHYFSGSCTINRQKLVNSTKIQSLTAAKGTETPCQK